MTARLDAMETLGIWAAAACGVGLLIFNAGSVIHWVLVAVDRLVLRPKLRREGKRQAKAVGHIHPAPPVHRMPADGWDHR